MIDDRTFQNQADNALESLNRALSAAADKYEFEADLNAGALTIEFEDPPARFVVSPNSPVRQIWVSAESKSYKLDWDEARGEFVLPSGTSLKDVIAEAVGRQVGGEVKL